MDINERFEQFTDDFLVFDKVENKRSQRSDLHAFLMLDEIFPGTDDMVSWAGHDEICLCIDLEELNEKATDAQIQELVRCGVRCDGSYDALTMFV